MIDIIFKQSINFILIILITLYPLIDCNKCDELIDVLRNNNMRLGRFQSYPLLETEMYILYIILSMLVIFAIFGFSIPIIVLLHSIFRPR